MDYVTVVNRTSKNLEGTWDGRHYTLTPGEHAFPIIMAEAFKRQNPLMGSEDPRTLQCEYLIGIKELSDNCEPLEQSPALERIDRSKTPEKVVEVIRGNGLYAPAIDSSKPFAVGGAVESTFTKP